MNISINTPILLFLKTIEKVKERFSNTYWTWYGKSYLKMFGAESEDWNSVQFKGKCILQIQKHTRIHLGKGFICNSGNKYVDNNIVHSTIYIAKRRPKGLLLSNTQVFAVMRHEIGHSLGLAHTKNYNDIMYPMTNLAIATRQDIRSGDIQALYKLYGINPRK